ncbi:MAG: glutamate mutase L, partial [Actinomycetota bacterium]|nr:glutamate mutase L [Actinomycetota bacterium]
PLERGHPATTGGRAGLDDAGVAALRDAAPDVVLLVGGTDGGNAEALLGCAKALAVARWRGPVVVAGNVAAQGEASAILGEAGVPHVRADNVVPRIGVLAPDSARAAIRAMFLEHVIGGKHLSARADFTAMVRGATPDVVLTAVRLLAEQAGDVVVVDVGGATTDVHSVVEADPEDAGLARQVVGPMPVGRTVEGDLGMRWSAVDTVRAGREAALVAEAEYDDLADAARHRHADPSYLPACDREHAHDERLAALAVGVALRRHAGRQQVRFGPDGRLVERTGTDLREADLLVGSGGVLRHHAPEVAGRVLAASCGHDIEGGWLLPRAPRTAVDRDYVLAAAGLLAADHPEAARALLRRLLEGAQG